MTRKRIILGATLLLVLLRIGVLLGAEYLPSDINMPPQEKKILLGMYSRALVATNEPALWRLAEDRKNVSYRFGYLRTGKSVILRLDRVRKTKWILTVKQVDSADEGMAVNRKKVLTAEDVSHFQHLFALLQFWQLPTVGALEAEYFLLDGTWWILEAVENGRYHIMRRRSPDFRSWNTVPDYAQLIDKLRKEDGYPYIDRATSDEANKKLIELGDFFVKLSGLQLKMY